MQLRTAALVGLLGLGLGWALAGRFQTAPAVDPQRGRASQGPLPLGVSPSTGVAPLAEHLRLKLDRQPQAPRPARNPFVFGTGRVPRTGPPAAVAPTPEATAAVEPPTPPSPGAEFTLAGMATTNGPDGPELTAMVHDGRGLLFVKRGDILAGGFEVVDVQDTAVTIRDSAGNARTLRLR